jgi:acetyl esterase/lipase
LPKLSAALASRHSYGPDASQFGDLYEGGDRGVAVLIHGGFWRDRYGLTLMEPLAADLVARGWTAWNIEYRRLGSGGGVPETLDDAGAAIDHLASLGRADGPVVAIGHSAGGHLAAWAATREDPAVPLTGVVSQAGVVDVRRAWELGLSNDVAREFLRGDLSLCALASPIDRLPLSAPALLVHGVQDDIVPPEISEAFAAASGAELRVFAEEDHFGHLDPQNPMWKAVVEWLAKPRPAGSSRSETLPGGDAPAGKAL